jgi:hypothetical protein
MHFLPWVKKQNKQNNPFFLSLWLVVFLNGIIFLKNSDFYDCKGDKQKEKRIKSNLFHDYILYVYIGSVMYVYTYTQITFE